MSEKIPYILSEVKKLYLSGLSAESIFRNHKDLILPENKQDAGSIVSVKKLIQRMKAGQESLKITPSEVAKRTSPSQGSGSIINNKIYTEKKIEYSDELIDEIDTLTKNKKYKTVKQVENELFKKFKDPKYTVAPKVDPRNAFFNKSEKVFTIPREYELYGTPYGKRKIAENRIALKQIIGTKFFANNPNYEKTAGLLTSFYTNPDSEFTKKEIDTMRKFVKDFSVTRSADAERSIPGSFFKGLQFDFGRKLKDFGKIFNLAEYLKELTKNPKISSADKAFYTKELNQILGNRSGILKSLSNKYPNLFKYKVSDTGNLQFEHRIARALGETGDLKLPKDYIARGRYVPGRFNQAKYFAYDQPLMELISEYNTASKTEKPNVKLKIENLTKDFNKRSGNFLEGVNFKFTDKVKMTEDAPLISKVKDSDLLFDIDKSLKQSNKFFESFGDERLKGMPKGSVASDFISKGPEFDLFNKLVRAVKKSPQSCRTILNYQTGGISTTCALALEKDPVGSAQKLQNLDVQSGPLATVKNAATKFLQSPLTRGAGKFGALAAVGAAATGAVKKFMNDDPTTYLSNEEQQKNMLIDMVTGQLDDTPQQSPAVLDYQLPVLGAGAVAGTAAVAPSTIEAARSGALGAKKSGITKTALKTLGRGLSALGTPAALLATEPLFIAGQVQQGDSLAEIATNPANYLGAAFAGPATEFATKGLSPTIAKTMRLGISPSVLKTVSRRFGLPGLALSAGISGFEMFDDYRNKRGMFREE
tara:strand:+ start:1075 stop:3360 length:2286 start_codon:yes stop_codon:yes gene_type:complete